TSRTRRPSTRTARTRRSRSGREARRAVRRQARDRASPHRTSAPARDPALGAAWLQDPLEAFVAFRRLAGSVVPLRPPGFKCDAGSRDLIEFGTWGGSVFPWVRRLWY